MFTFQIYKVELMGCCPSITNSEGRKIWFLKLSDLWRFCLHDKTTLSDQVEVSAGFDHI